MDELGALHCMQLVLTYAACETCDMPVASTKRQVANALGANPVKRKIGNRAKVEHDVNSARSEAVGLVHVQLA